MIIAILISLVVGFVGGYLFCSNNPPASLRKKIKDRL